MVQRKAGLRDREASRQKGRMLSHTGIEYTSINQPWAAPIGLLMVTGFCVRDRGQGFQKGPNMFRVNTHHTSIINRKHCEFLNSVFLYSM